MDAKNIIISPVKIEERKNLHIQSGDTIKVWQKIKEKDKTRLQVFEGLVLAVKHGKQAGGTFTVRKVASGVGVERTFPIYSSAIDKIEIVKRSKTRQSKLYHIRDKAVKEIKRQMRNIRKLPDVISADESVVEKKNIEQNEESQDKSEEAQTPVAGAVVDEEKKEDQVSTKEVFLETKKDSENLDSSEKKEVRT